MIIKRFSRKIICIILAVSMVFICSGNVVEAAVNSKTITVSLTEKNVEKNYYLEAKNGEKICVKAQIVQMSGTPSDELVYFASCWWWDEYTNDGAKGPIFDPVQKSKFKKGLVVTEEYSGRGKIEYSFELPAGLKNLKLKVTFYTESGRNEIVAVKKQDSSASNTSNQSSDSSSIITFTDGTGSSRIKYQVTSSSKEKSTVMVYKAAVDAKTVTIPKTVTDQTTGQTYKVTGITENAFKNRTKLTSVVIESNIKTIGANAFSGCKKLESVTIYANNLSKVGANAFEGIKKGAEVKVSAKSRTRYEQIKKLLKDSGLKDVTHKYRIQ